MEIVCRNTPTKCFISGTQYSLKYCQFDKIKRVLFIRKLARYPYLCFQITNNLRTFNGKHETIASLWRISSESKLYHDFSFSNIVLRFNMFQQIFSIFYFKFKLNIETAAATAAKSLQSCPTLCDPIDGSPLGSSVPGILQARTLEWVAISFSSA